MEVIGLTSLYVLSFNMQRFGVGALEFDAGADRLQLLLQLGFVLLQKRQVGLPTVLDW